MFEATGCSISIETGPTTPADGSESLKSNFQLYALSVLTFLVKGKISFYWMLQGMLDMLEKDLYFLSDTEI